MADDEDDFLLQLELAEAILAQEEAANEDTQRSQSAASHPQLDAATTASGRTSAAASNVGGGSRPSSAASAPSSAAGLSRPPTLVLGPGSSFSSSASAAPPRLTPTPTSQQHSVPASATSTASSAGSASSSRGAAAALALAKGDVEEYSGLRITKRTIAAADVSGALLGMAVHKLSALASLKPEQLFGPGTRTMPTQPMATGWATVGILSRRSGARQSSGSKGGSFAVWTLTDFSVEVSVFLFDAAFNEYATEAEATMFVVVAPMVLPATDNKAFALSVSRVDQLVRLGTSRDFGRCRSATKEGKPCAMPVDLSKNPYCKYHTAAEYKKALAARPALLGAGSGRPMPAGPAATQLSQGRYGHSTAAFFNSQLSRSKTGPPNRSGSFLDSEEGVRASLRDDIFGYEADGCGFTGAAATGAAPTLQESLAQAMAASSKKAALKTNENDPRSSSSSSGGAKSAAKAGKPGSKDRGADRVVGLELQADGHLREIKPLRTPMAYFGAAADIRGQGGLLKPEVYAGRLEKGLAAAAAAAAGPGGGGGGVASGHAGLSAEALQRRHKRLLGQEGGTLLPDPTAALKEVRKRSAVASDKDKEGSSAPVAAAALAGVKRPREAETTAASSSSSSSSASAALVNKPTGSSTGANSSSSSSSRPSTAPAPPATATATATATAPAAAAPAAPRARELDPQAALALLDKQAALYAQKNSASGAAKLQLGAGAGAGAAGIGAGGYPNIFAQHSQQQLQQSRPLSQQQLQLQQRSAAVRHGLPHQHQHHQQQQQAAASLSQGGQPRTAQFLPEAKSQPMSQVHADPLGALFGGASALHGEAPAAKRPRLDGASASASASAAAATPAGKAVDAASSAGSAFKTPATAAAAAASAAAAAIVDIWDRTSTPLSQPLSQAQQQAHQQAQQQQQYIIKGPILTHPHEVDRMRATLATHAVREAMRAHAYKLPAPASMEAAAAAAAATPATPVPLVPGSQAYAAQSQSQSQPSQRFAPPPSSSASSSASGNGLSAEQMAVLSATSLYATEAEDVKLAAVEQRMEARERLENMEATMREATSREVTRWECLECLTMTEKPSSLCSAEGHTLKPKKLLLHAFRCAQCGNHTEHAATTCAKACGKCGHRLWVSTTIHRHLKEGTDSLTHASERLKPRGEKQVNSLRYG